MHAHPSEPQKSPSFKIFLNSYLNLIDPVLIPDENLKSWNTECLHFFAFYGLPYALIYALKQQQKKKKKNSYRILKSQQASIFLVNSWIAV